MTAAIFDSRKERELVETPRALIVVPAFNEAARLPLLLSGIRAYVARAGAPAPDVAITFLLVDDGSSREQAERELALVGEAGLDDTLRFERFERNRGKGAALRHGFSRAVAEQFEFVGFMDGDYAVAVSEVERALAYLAAADGRVAGVIGSRVAMLGRTVERRPLRHYAGRVFATFVSFYFDCTAYDTQCGLKIFRTDAVATYLEVPVDCRWLWDTELLLAMLRGGEVIHELPVDWRERGGSKVSLLRDAPRMVWELIKFRRRLDRDGPPRN